MLKPQTYLWQHRAKLMIALLLICLIGFIPSFGQVKFYAAAPKSVPLNGNFQLNYTVENGSGSNLKPAPFNDFQVLGGPNTSTSMQWINGNVTQSVTYSYILRPKKEGTFKIGKASVQVGGVNLESNEISIEVTAPVAQQQQQQRQRQRNPFDPFDDPFFNGGQEEEEQPQAASADVEKQLKDDVFMKLVVNKSSVYKGEMLTATYKLYFRQNLSGFNVTKAPAFDGYWSQELELDPKRRPVVENVNGKQYNTIELLKYNLYPQRSGSLPVASCEVSTVAQVQVRSRSRSVFDDFFNMGRVQQVPLTLKTSSAVVNVKELPDEGKPVAFSGAVGRYKFETTLSSKQTKTDEPITYSVKISGNGNLKFVDAPPLTFPAEFEVYDPKTKENITQTAEGMSGTKQYDYLLIPRQPGEFKLESKTFSWFEPASAKYFTINSPEFTVKVTGEPSKNINAIASATGTNKEDISLVGQDIRYLKTNTPIFEKGNSFLGSAGFVAAYSAPFLLFIGLIAVKRRNDKMAGDVIGTKRRKALKQAKKRLANAEKYLAKQDRKNFYDEVSRAIWGYLGDKLSIDMAELSKENVEEKLLTNSARFETVTKLKTLLSTCDMALYAPVGEAGEMKSNYEIAMNLMADLEDEIKPSLTKSTAPYSSLLVFFLLQAMLLGFTTSAHAETAEQIYNSGQNLYKNNQFDQAAAAYEKLVMQGYRTPEVYYNLGNSYYKAAKNGLAILNYERALKLAPTDEDIRHNLKLAELKAVDKIVPVPQLAVTAAWKNFTTSQSSRGWGYIALAGIWVSLLLFAVYLFVSKSRSWVLLGFTALLISFCTLSLSANQSQREENSGYGILLVQNVVVKSAPDINGTDLFSIHEGIKFQVVDQVGNWTKIRLADGKVGWIEKNLFQTI